MTQPILEIQHISKSFPGVQALSQVNLKLYPSEVLAVIGENGAGKSTLMKILAGVQEPDSGTILLDGKPVKIRSVAQAMEMGVVIIHQELNLADNLDVATNVFLGREPYHGGILGWVNRRKTEEVAEQLMKRLGMNISPRTKVRDLTIGHQQMVEIAKALSINARIIIMDEPSSSLTQHETEQLFRVIHELRSQGTSIVYISHRLGEVKEVADRVTVLRDGCNAGELSRDEISHDRMVKLMVGRDIQQIYQHTTHEPASPVLEVRNLVVHGFQNSISFTLHEREIVGLAGLVGAGRTELAQTIFGMRPQLGGFILMDGKPVSIQNARDAIRAGIAYVPEDRKLQGLILEMSVLENVSLPGLPYYQSASFIQFSKEREVAQEMSSRLNIKTPSLKQTVQYLSGGNQQKVVLAKWLSLHPRVLILDEPTRGIDIGAKQEIYSLMEQLALSGVAILMISSEMQEVLGMSDRVYVMHEGQITGQLSRAELSEEAIMKCATGTHTTRMET
ncbi:MAG: sugar ABC transporter ATP-binding protein [bacterium]|jgi:ribose transport system ATP-binding protein